MNKKWQIYETDTEETKWIAEKYKINELLASIIANRKIKDEDIEKFLHPTRQNFHDPFLMPDMNIAVERIIKAIENGEKLPNIVSQNPSNNDITLSINYYYQNTISYLIENYSDHEIEIDGIIRLYKGDYLIYEEESYSYNLNKNRDHLDYIKLENRLDVGDYLLELGDIKCSFTIN